MEEFILGLSGVQLSKTLHFIVHKIYEPITHSIEKSIRRNNHTLTVWLSLPLAFINFYFLSERDDVHVCDNDGVGCTIAGKVVRWIILMFFFT